MVAVVDVDAAAAVASLARVSFLGGCAAFVRCLLFVIASFFIEARFMSWDSSELA